ncbi:helix-turn-helix domain-containing protein [Oricola sp.]|uniref:helix-turn-helix domain-containing protein n=1 Tax=Oricola sp. TaxID=1979950 RepID=UPI003BAAA3C2
MLVPLPWMVSLLAAIAALTLLRSPGMPRAARYLLAGFLIVLGLAGLLLGLRLGYGVSWARTAQLALALTPMPLAFLGFRALTQENGPDLRRLLLVHALPIAILTALCVFGVPFLADVAVPGVAAVYVVGMVRLAQHGPDAFMHVSAARFGHVRGALWATIMLAALMIASDVVIFFAVLRLGNDVLPSVIAGASGVFVAMVVVTALIGLPLALRAPAVHDAGSGGAAPSPPSDEHRTVMERLDTLMEETALFTDSNLTLARVARRLALPARDVSNAVNRMTGENFSRYVNGHRVARAKALLAESDLPVTEIIFASGFTTKSSFNSEFRRVTGQTPTAFRAAETR